ncbi:MULTISPECIES: DEAD/DEAH box helicase [Streptomyces]|uniref:SNF2-related protein n=1 Tax=Streptomyces doudnae TaxID=3075536 RepID=A0ABD5EK89_9ACTN|nr:MULTISPECIES: SNF2-related protein [unclassified Streptomyces]MDT0434474.1 SNF2-related protein [Streptomyces sp. DSM 41981]MYQ69008.1 ATP-dependent helicase [Streptomyces sp. SID4950]SCE50697.1 Helicase conserved C-terminal domain-containing protein [Streptomyces sp. SolWspMP-5a-2]
MGEDSGEAVVGRRARELCERGAGLRDTARTLLDDHERALDAVRAALTPLRDELVAAELESIPVARLKDATEGRLRLAAVEAAGFATVRAVHEAGRHQLRQIPGVGAQTADQVLAAAGQIARAVEETVSVRIDVDHPEPRTTALVIALHRLVEAGPELRRAVDTARRVDGALGDLLPAARPTTGRLRLALTGARRRTAALEAGRELRALVADAETREVGLLLAQATTDLLRGPVSEIEAWVDFELRSAEYYSQLVEVGAPRGEEQAADGFLPTDVVERVQAQPLDDAHRRVSLRGYQSFGARFALAQRRVVLGDEMGLGKTVQAIAALAHLAAQGHSHFLVVCPAGVLINWTREIRSRSTLRAHPVHGPERLDAHAEWRERGGVALTTFDVLHTLPAPGEGGAPAMLVVDEAHYVKNPETRRARSVAEWTARCEHVLFLTGTPMENRVGEFRSLVRMLRPELVPEIRDSDAAAGPHVFRRTVAPAYLRRNQRDVLTELPALLQVDEWAEPSPADQDAYRAAVAAGNFMAMRRAAYADPEHSAKLRRLRELVAEAAENGHKTVVFSYFRDVTGAVRDALPEPVFGPLSGGLPVGARQRLVDDFTHAEGPAVLLAQIEAGGVGLNLQAASVVVLCEPQVKPTLEHQAVARAHRMGQVRPVQVHRLLVTDGVDARLLRILENKTRLFDAYARRSDTADATPDAVDVSDVGIARRIVEEEQLRLATGAA